MLLTRTSSWSTFPVPGAPAREEVNSKSFCIEHYTKTWLKLFFLILILEKKILKREYFESKINWIHNPLYFSKNIKQFYKMIIINNLYFVWQNITLFWQFYYFVLLFFLLKICNELYHLKDILLYFLISFVSTAHKNVFIRLDYISQDYLWVRSLCSTY